MLFCSFAQVDFWLDRADFYDQEWMPAVKTFDSFEELALKLGVATKSNLLFLSHSLLSLKMCVPAHAHISDNMRTITRTY
jgi:hypothetical protein